MASRADRLRGVGNTRSGAPHDRKPICEAGTPLRRTIVVKESSGLRSDQSDELAGKHVGLVLGAFLGRQLALIAFASQLLNASLRLTIRAVIQDLPRILAGQAPGDRLEDFIENRRCRGNSHTNSIA